MKFSGRLQVEADSRSWLKADLVLDRGKLELTSGDDVLGTWAASQVTAERVEGDRFSLQLGDETAMFIADDALGFSYEALPQLNKRHLLPVGGMMDKLKSGFRADESRPVSEERVSIPAAPGPASAASLTGKRLRELIKEAAGTPSPPPTSAGDPEPKRSLGFEGVFKRRQAASEDSTALAPEAATPPQDEDLLERLFDSSPDIPDEDPLVEKVEESAPIWADLEPPSPSVGDEPRPIFEEESTFSLADPEPIDWSANPLGETSADTKKSLAPSWAGWSPLEEPAGETESLLRPGYLPDSDGDQASPSLRSRPASPASEPSSGMVEAVEVLVRAVAAGALSESQLNAITDLVRAVAAASRPTPPTY